MSCLDEAGQSVQVVIEPKATRTIRCQQSGNASIPNSTHSELVARKDRPISLKVNFYQFLTMDFPSLLILKSGENLLGACIDDLSGGRVGEPTIDTESDPTRLFSNGDRSGLFGRLDGVVEDMQSLIVCVDHPHLLFIGSQTHTMAWTSMPLDWALFEATHFDAMEFFAGDKVADFKSRRPLTQT